MQQKIQTIIMNSLKALRDDLGIEINAEINETFPLIGDESELESLSLVQLIVEVEEAVEEETGTSIELISDENVLGTETVLKTVTSFADYISNQL
ncbi:hypothetical protein QGN29_09105 [Temperatibacter marinus]|uniref:Carrier domain-containing protein n=1 Tax=Temperatibacter marinus TaxID=1456591 RepID=A0AA52EBD5_9PROT|nr:hypothetical protein [Temperatibacter marinus]WND01711.1 hypothetical protein QGN29_09105 [Temperatibacter marinus]